MPEYAPKEQKEKSTARPQGEEKIKWSSDSGQLFLRDPTE
jgi:hypothetical protein